MEKDLDVYAFPPLAMHCVIGGEEDIHAADRNVAHVMEVTPTTFKPRATQLAWRNGYLICVGADDGFECARCRGHYIGIDVNRRWQRNLPWQAVLAPVFRTPQFAQRTVSDGWQRRACQVRAVREDRLPRPVAAETAVGEATALELHVELERHRVARLERLVERPDVMALYII